MTNNLTVTVKHDPLTRTVKVEPSQITLRADVRHVIWCCDLRAAGESLEIQFDSGATGPFQRLEPSGACIVGSGNAGLGQPQFHYQVRIQTAGIECVGEGVVINDVTAKPGGPASGPMVMLRPRLPEGPPGLEI